MSSHSADCHPSSVSIGRFCESARSECRSGLKRELVRTLLRNCLVPLVCAWPSLCGFALGTALGAAAIDTRPQVSAVEYLSDCPELIASASQGWGELGWNVAAHQAGQAGVTLQIAGKHYDKGLGHHASGSITVLLDGDYVGFDAEVGLQPCGAGGSVIFSIYKDGELVSDSGVVWSTNAARAVHVPLAGAQELVLEARDAGDGINCDMANWANARLTRAATARGTDLSPRVDAARFGRVVTWDPNRKDGCRANRIQEFLAEDVFLETDVKAGSDGGYLVPMNTNGLGCIGLQWLNRRALKEAGLEFTSASAMPPTNAVRVEGWFGESAWQGSWKPLLGELQRSGHRLTLRLSPKGGAVQTQKIRWIFPTEGKVALRSLSAFTRSRWQTVKLRIETEKPTQHARGELAVINGEFLDGMPAQRTPEGIGPGEIFRPCRFSSPLRVAVWYSVPSSFKSDPTILQFRLPTGSFGVAVADVLSAGCVYLPQYGVFVTRDSSSISLADYKRTIAARKTILQQVRQMPDQTLAQAMARTHHDAQHEGPVMLSLACDNAKFVVERDGTLRFQARTNLTSDWFATAGELRLQCADGRDGRLTRALDGGWLPVPVITTEHSGVLYRQRTFVAPGDASGNDPARLNRLPVCVVELTITNTHTIAAPVSVKISVLPDKRQKLPAALPQDPSISFPLGDGNLQGRIVSDHGLSMEARGATASFTGTLPPLSSSRVSIYLADPQVDLKGLPVVARLREQLESYWKAALASAMQVETPEPLLNNLIRSAQVRCLIAARNEADGARVAPWIAAMSYGPLESEAHSVIRGMEFMGHREFARRSLDFFIHRYNTNGFLTTGYTTFGTAWHLWTLGEHYQLSHDTNWLRQAAPEIARVGKWIVRQTEKTKARPLTSAAPPESGLMPPGVLADWNSFACHFAMNAYYYAALRELGETLGDIGHPDAALFKQRAAELRASTLRAYAWTQARSPALALGDGTWIPHYPSQVHSPGKLADFFPGQDAGRSWCYDVELGAHQLVPTGVFDAHSPEVDRIMDHMEEVQFLSDGWFDYPASMNAKDWFNLGGFSKVQPYYTRNCEVYALRDEVKPFIRSYFNTLAAMLNPEVMTFWEHFNHSGAWDKTHETGYFLHQTRTMLVMERGNDLWLAPLITTNWLTNGKKLAITDAPTRFGPVSYRLESRIADGCILASITPPTRKPPAQIVLRLRHPEHKRIRSVLLNGKRHTAFDARAELVRIAPTGASLDLQVFYK